MIYDDNFHFSFKSKHVRKLLKLTWPEKKSTFMLAVHCYIVVTFLENVSCVINKNTIFIAVIVHHK